MLLLALALSVVDGLLCLQLAPSRVEGEWPVELPIPADRDANQPLGVSQGARKPRPAQVVGKNVVFLARNEPGEFALEVSPVKPLPLRAICSDDGKRLLLTVDGRNVLQYNYAVVEQPDPVYSRSGYLHPVWTPAGKIVTHDAPPNHLHHHGIWSAWTSSEFEGRKSNFWESKEKQGRVDFVKVEHTYSGPVCAGFRARHRFLNLNGPGGEKAALEEVWEVRVYALTDRHVVDLISTQTCATDQPLVIKEYRYGGIGFRGSADWEGKGGVDFLTDGGKGRVDGHATKARWVTATGKIGGADAAVGFLCHPSDFRFPQPVRIHPDEPFFNWAVPQGGTFSIEPGKPYVAKYRFIVADGALSAEAMNGAWSSYGEPPKFSVIWSPDPK